MHNLFTTLRKRETASFFFFFEAKAKLQQGRSQVKSSCFLQLYCLQGRRATKANVNRVTGLYLLRLAMLAKGLVLHAVSTSKPERIDLSLNEIVHVKEVSEETGEYLVEKEGGGGSVSGLVPKACITLAKSFIPIADYAAESSSEISLKCGTRVLGFIKEGEWWWGCTAATAAARAGYFPATYVGSPQVPTSIPLSSGAPPTKCTKKREECVPPQPPPVSLCQSESQAQRKDDITSISIKIEGSPGKRGDPKSVGISGGRKFKGRYPLQFLVWGNNMALASALCMIILGFFTVLWSKPKHYGCKIGGSLINEKYLAPINATATGAVCDPDEAAPNLNGSSRIGLFSIVLGVLIFLFEGYSYDDRMWCCYYPSDR